MQHIKYAETQAHKTHKTRETQIYVVHLVWATSTMNNQSFLFIIQQNEETQPTTYPLFSLTVSLSVSRSENTHTITHPQYNTLIQVRGCLLGQKTLNET